MDPHNAEAQAVQDMVPALGPLELLDAGGQKVVYRASHQQHGDVVVKVVRGNDQRAMREIQVATDCQIPHTARLHDWGRVACAGGSSVYIVEEFVPGVTIRHELRTQGALSRETVLGLLSGLLEAAMAMEGAGVVHRDIKPENIILQEDRSIRLIDFGIARLLQATSLTPTDDRWGPHTAGYAAPEQFRNMKAQIDIRADLFSIGVVAYECLSGRNPFTDGARDVLEVWRRTEQTIPPPVSPGELGSFIAVLMSQYPSRRPPSAAVAKRWFDDIAAASPATG